MSVTAIIVNASRPDDPLGPEIVAEFDGLLQRLDLKYIRRHEWERIKTILTIATLEAGDAESGAEGYRRALEKWRMSRFFDGHE